MLKFVDKESKLDALMDYICNEFLIPKDVPAFREFFYGSCQGLWRETEDAVELLAVVNNKKGNGNFTKLMFYFERKANGRKVRVLEVLNDGLGEWLVKRGYVRYGTHYVRHGDV